MISLRQWLLRRQGEILTMIGVVGTPVVSLIAGVVLVKFLTPAQVGTLNIAALWPAYLGFLHLGTLTGMARELPLSIGARDLEQSERILKVTSAIVWRASLVGALICLIFAWLLGWKNGDRLLGSALAVGAITITSNNILLRIDTALRAFGRFRQYGVIQITCNVVNLGTTFLIPYFGATGAIGRLGINGLAAWAVRSGTGYRWQPWAFDWGEIRQLMTVGFPLLMSGMLFTFLMVADRSIVALMLPRAEVGYFSLAAIIVNSMQFVPQGLSMIVFPKMARVYGETRRASALRPYVLKTLWLNLTALIPLSAAVYLLFPLLIRKYFPDYNPGIRAGQLACGTCVFWVYLGMGSVFGVLNRLRAYLTVLGLSVGLVWIAGYILIIFGYGIEGAAAARLLATAVICVFTIWYSLRLTSSAPEKGEKGGDA